MKNIILPENTLLLITGDESRNEFVKNILCRWNPVYICNFGKTPPNDNLNPAINESHDLFFNTIGKKLKAGIFTSVDVEEVSNTIRQKMQELCNRYYFQISIIFFTGNNETGKWDRRISSLKKNGIKNIYILDKNNIHDFNVEVKPVNAFCNIPPPYDIIGDVHGCLDELEELFGKLGYEKTDSIYIHPDDRMPIFIGDIADRGPKSVETIELVLDMIEMNKAMFIPGNHCYKLARYLGGKNITMKFGVEITGDELNSIDNDRREKLEAQFVNLVENSPYYLILDKGNLVISHAGIKEKMIGRQHRKIRDFCLYGATTGKLDEFGLPERINWAAKYKGKPFIVYGHTPVGEAEVYNNTVNIDQGCAFGGKLTALRYPEMESVSIKAKKSYYCRLRMKRS